MPSATPQPVAGPSTQVLQPHNTRKRSSSNVEVKDSKKLKREATTDSIASSTRDKKKRRKSRPKKRKNSIVKPQLKPTPTMAPSRSASVSSALTPVSSDAEERDVPDTPATPIPEDEPIADIDQSEPPLQDKGKGRATSPTPSEALPSRIARLTQQHQEQSVLLEQHQSLIQSLQQSLTCQICLDFLHKPFALAPCGHVTCYNCLVRWFTSPPDEGAPPARHQQNHIYRKKTCPVCRTIVFERPVEVWGIKSMVTTLTRSGLATLPEGSEATQTGSASATNGTGSRHDDPWHNIFRPSFRHRTVAPPIAPAQDGEGGGLDDIGMYDAEDGGIYRCIECMHEIWGGVCSSCQRPYPGHLAGRANANNDNLEAIMGMLARHIDYGDSDEDDDSDISDIGPGPLHLFMPHSDEENADQALGWYGQLDPLTEEEYSNEEDGSGQEYESSFIDDEDAQGAQNEHTSVRSFDHGQEEDGQDDEVMANPEPELTELRVRRLRRFGLDDDDADTSEAENQPRRGQSAVSTSASRNSRAAVLDSDSDEGTRAPRRSTRSLQNQASQLGRGMRIGGSQRDFGDVLSEDDQPIAGPSRPIVRRRTVNARASSSRSPMVVVVDTDEESQSDSDGDSDNERPRHYVRFDQWERDDDHDEDDVEANSVHLDGDDEEEGEISPPSRRQTRSGGGSFLQRVTRSSSSRHRR